MSMISNISSKSIPFLRLKDKRWDKRVNDVRIYNYKIGKKLSINCKM